MSPLITEEYILSQVIDILTKSEHSLRATTILLILQDFNVDVVRSSINSLLFKHSSSLFSRHPCSIQPSISMWSLSGKVPKGYPTKEITYRVIKDEVLAIIKRYGESLRAMTIHCILQDTVNQHILIQGVNSILFTQLREGNTIKKDTSKVPKWSLLESNDDIDGLLSHEIDAFRGV